MSTVVALETQGGVAIAADGQTADDGTITSRRVQHLVETDAVGAGVVGEPGDVQAFQRELTDELRQIRIERDEVVGIDTLGRIAARLAERSNVAAAVAAHDADGIARLRQVSRDGAVLEGPTVAIGDGAELAAGQLETVESGLDVDATERILVAILGRVANRDTETGGDIDVWSLPHASDGED